MKISFISLLTVLAQIASSQNIEYYSPKEKLYKKEIMMFSQHYIFSSNHAVEYDLEKLTPNLKDSSTIFLKNGTVQVKLTTKRSDETMHILEKSDSLGYLIRIDGKPFYRDYVLDTPQTEIKDIYCTYRDQFVTIPKSSYSDLYDPFIFFDETPYIEAHLSLDKERLYIYIQGMNSGYEVTLIVDGGIYIGRLLIDESWNRYHWCQLKSWIKSFAQ